MTAGASSSSSSSAMAFLLRLRTIHTLTNPSRSLSLLHHHRLLSTSNSGAGDLLRLRTFLTLTTPSQLHRHRTSNSVAGDNPNTNQPFLFSLRKIQTFLLHHLRRLLSTSDSGTGDHPNSNNPSPSTLRELREAVKSLSASDCIVESKTPTYTTFSFVPSSNSTAAAADFNATASFNLDEKLQQMKMRALILGERQITDRQRLWKLKESRIELRDEVLKNLANHISLVQKHKGRRALSSETREMLVDEIDSIIAELMKFKDMLMESANLLEMLTDSRLDSLKEIVKNLSEIRGDLQDEVWDELNEGLVRCEQMELKEAEMLAVEIRQQMQLLIPQVQKLFQIRHSYL
ncbi:uncharacterized protein LOC130715895 [Lotus japonicus]|uniref:uncharacterized protein LOC130715895 n=1 Tax=Lotus japonicus TaxID=34305 RepID=UPI002588FC85|nr:uncharacterized protein LOC130715895 [Lotus japonicus]